MSRERIENLTAELYAKLEEISRVAVETQTGVSIQIGWQTYDVYLPAFEDEDMNDFLQNEYGHEEGDWISSSERC